MKFKLILEIMFWKAEMKEGHSFHLGAPEENVSYFIVVPSAVKRSIYLDGVKSDAPMWHHTQRRPSAITSFRGSGPFHMRFSLMPPRRDF